MVSVWYRYEVAGIQLVRLCSILCAYELPTAFGSRVRPPLLHVIQKSEISWTKLIFCLSLCCFLLPMLNKNKQKKKSKKNHLTSTKFCDFLQRSAISKIGELDWKSANSYLIFDRVETNKLDRRTSIENLKAQVRYEFWNPPLENLLFTFIPLYN